MNTKIQNMPKELKEATVKEIAQKSLFYFTTAILGYPDMVKRIHGKICDILEGNEWDILISQPRGTYKTTLVSIAYPLWMLAKNPNIRALIRSAKMDLPIAIMREIKSHITSNELFIRLFGKLESDLKWTNSEIIINTKNSYNKECTVTLGAVESGKVGGKFDIIINTDIENADDRESLAIREKKIRDHEDSYSLLDANGRMVTEGTRWHHQALYSVMLDSERYIKDKNLYFASSYNEDGSLWFPEVLSEEVLEKKRSAQPSQFAAHYLNDPSPQSDRTIREIHYYKERPALGTMDIIAWSDPAMGKKAGCDTAIITLGRDKIDKSKLYVLKVTLKKIGIPDYPRAILQHELEIEHDMIGIESNSAQELFLFNTKEFLNKEGHYVNMIGITANKNKDQRIKSFSYMINDGMILFPYDPDQDTKELIRQCLDFNVPHTRNVDGPDCLEGAVKVFEKYFQSDADIIFGGEKRQFGSQGNISKTFEPEKREIQFSNYGS